MKSITTASIIALSLVTQPVMADDLLERLEIATEKIGANQGEFYISRVPELAEKMPSWEWDDEIRTASKCVLDGIANAKGDAVAEAYVAGLEKEAQKVITSMASLGSEENIPAQLKGGDQTIATLMQSCGTMEISVTRLKESGLWEAMFDQSVMQRLTAE